MTTTPPAHLLFQAVTDNNPDDIDRHLNTGACNIDALSDSPPSASWVRHTPLTLAAQLGHVRATARLLERGARLDSLNEMRHTALHEACACGHIKVAELLLDRGADLEHRTPEGETALILALCSRKHDMVTWLLDRGARLDVRDNSDRTALYWAVFQVYPDVRRVLECPAVLELLDVKCGWEGSAVLHAAAGQGHVDDVRHLLAAGAAVNVNDMDGGTPLHLACEGGYVEVMCELLLHDADVDAVDNSGSTPLMRVICAQGWTAGHPRAVKLLLEQGADRSFRNHKGGTARDIAEARTRFWAGMQEVVDVLDTYFPITPSMAQLLLGTKGPTESPLTRFASHSAFEPNVLSLIKCLLTGENNPAFHKLHNEA